MSKEKHIAEMHNDLNEIFDEEYGERRLISAYHTAKSLYEKGYRKQSEGEWIWDFTNYKCSLCGEYDMITPKFCRGCGAKMKGGAE